MPDEITITPKTDSTPLTSGQPNQSITLGRTQLVNLCATGLAVSFFLPWAHFFGTEPSGYDLQQMGNEQRLLWLIPILSVITIFAGATKRSQKVVGQLTGVLPFAVGAYWLHKLGSDLTKILAVGAYLSLMFGGALLILPRKLK